MDSHVLSFVSYSHYFLGRHSLFSLLQFDNSLEMILCLEISMLAFFSLFFAGLVAI